MCSFVFFSQIVITAVAMCVCMAVGAPTAEEAKAEVAKSAEVAENDKDKKEDVDERGLYGVHRRPYGGYGGGGYGGGGYGGGSFQQGFNQGSGAAGE